MVTFLHPAWGRLIPLHSLTTCSSLITSALFLSRWTEKWQLAVSKWSHLWSLFQTPDRPCTLLFTLPGKFMCSKICFTLSLFSLLKNREEWDKQQQSEDIQSWLSAPSSNSTVQLTLLTELKLKHKKDKVDSWITVINTTSITMPLFLQPQRTATCICEYIYMPQLAPWARKHLVRQSCNKWACCEEGFGWITFNSALGARIYYAPHTSSFRR